MRTSNRVLVLAIVMVLSGIANIGASVFQAGADDITTGAQLYDKWYAVAGVEAPEGNMPAWERQSTNTRSGPDTWRCSECHGWDYKGSEGEYASGSHATGFPNVMKLSASLSEQEIIDHLHGSKDPSHDFSKYLADEDIARLTKFLKEGIKDDSALVDAVTHKAVGGNLQNGKTLYEGQCAKCHGADGKTIIFRNEGINEYLGTVATRDPYRFIHRTRYGVAGVKEMPVGRQLGWKDSDSVDVLAYVQSLPTGVENETQSNAGASSETSPKLGGPQGGVFGGILTGIAAFFGMFGLSAFFLFGLVVIAVLIVWALRKRK